MNQSGVLLAVVVVAVLAAGCTQASIPSDGSGTSPSDGNNVGVTGNQQTDWAAIVQLEQQAKSVARTSGCAREGESDFALGGWFDRLGVHSAGEEQSQNGGEKGFVDHGATDYTNGGPQMLLRVLLHAGQVDGAALGIGLAAVKEGGVADGADAHATAFVGDLGAEGGAFIAISAEEAEFQ